MERKNSKKERKDNEIISQDSLNKMTLIAIDEEAKESGEVLI